MRGQREGSALGGTLLVVVLLFVFGLTLANLATFDLRLVNRTGERQMAREAAEAGLNHVTALIGGNPRLGTSNEVYQATLPNGSSYRISFDSDDPDWSLNNLASLTMAPRGADRNVPPNHALIFAEGRSRGGEVALIESLIRLEALPYAIAGSGKVRSNLAALVSGAYTGDQAQAGDANLPGSVYSGSDASDSTRLGLGSRVSGDLHSVGGAVLTGAVVEGDVETEHDVEQLPNLDIEDFNTSTVPGVQVLSGGLLGLPLAPLVLSGPVYIEGDTTFVAVTMNNATIFVNDGDLTVLALLGTGAIFVDGRTTFMAAIEFTGADRITLFSDGDITVGLLGVFRGVLLTNGNFTANGLLTVFGAIYANNPGNPSLGNVSLNGLLSIVHHVEEYTAFASFWLALGGQAEPVQVYWNQLR
jgi:hypothetical protein